jgi:hypothetical protein
MLNAAALGIFNHREPHPALSKGEGSKIMLLKSSPLERI